MISLLMSFIMLGIFGFILPFKDMLLNKLEIFNESTVILVIIGCLAFTDFLQDAELKHTMGWVVIGIILFNILLNIYIMMRTTYRAIKEKCIKWKRKRAIKKYHEYFRNNLSDASII